MPPKQYSLKIYTPLLAGRTNPRDVTDLAIGWRRSIRGQGGYWIGDFEINAPIGDVSKFFFENIGYHIEEYSGGQKTWEGLIYEMEYTNQNGVVRRVSLDSLYNKVKTAYIDESDAVQETSVASNTESQGIYGVREEIIYLDGVATAAAQAKRDTILKEGAWPYPDIISTTQSRVIEDRQRTDEEEKQMMATLNVVVCGYVFTGNWRYETAGDGSTDDVSTWIEEIVDTDCEFLSVGRVDSNTTQKKKEINTKKRAWDQINTLVGLGDSTGAPHRAYVTRERYVNYEAINTTPQYFLRNGILFNLSGNRVDANPWNMLPGVGRDSDYSVAKYPYNGWLEDLRDFWISEVEVQSDGTLVLKTNKYKESEILAAQMAQQKRLSEGRERGGGRGGGGRPVWLEYGIYSAAEWESMTAAERRAWKEKWAGMSTAERKAHRRKKKKEKPDWWK